MTDLKFAISSNKTFSPTTYKIVVNSFLDAGVPAEDIYFFSGGYTEYRKVDNPEGINYFEVPYSSMDFNSLISILELGLLADYWFVFQDTGFVGKEFYTKVKSYDYSVPVIPLTNQGFSMNIGAYSHQYIQSIRTDVLALRNTGNLSDFKSTLVLYEDRFLANHRDKAYTKIPPDITGPVDFYSNGVPRIIHYYEELDLYKTKANWELKSKYEINL